MKAKQTTKQPVRKQQHRIKFSNGAVHTFEIDAVNVNHDRNGGRINIAGKIIK